jgi:hypothetical protein
VQAVTQRYIREQGQADSTQGATSTTRHADTQDEPMARERANGVASKERNDADDEKSEKQEDACNLLVRFLLGRQVGRVSR